MAAMEREIATLKAEEGQLKEELKTLTTSPSICFSLSLLTQSSPKPTLIHLSNRKG
jgi:hypothetical protein